MRVEVIAGCMFSGKSTELIRRIRREQIAKRDVIVFKPSIDDRYDKEAVASHNGLRLPCTTAKTVDDMRFHLTGYTPDVVGIDEAQFFGEELVAFVQGLSRRGCRIVLAGLDLDAEGVPFGPMPFLLAEADDVTKLTAVCTVCGEPATRSKHMKGLTSQIEVGAHQYEARCRRHWRD